MRLYYNVPGPPEFFSKAGDISMRTAANSPCYPSVAETGYGGYLDRRLLNAPSFPNYVGLSTGQQRVGIYLLFLQCPMPVQIQVTDDEFEIGSTTSVAEAWWDHAWSGRQDWMRGIDFGINMREQLHPNCNSSARPNFPPC